MAFVCNQLETSKLSLSSHNPFNCLELVTPTKGCHWLASQYVIPDWLESLQVMPHWLSACELEVKMVWGPLISEAGKFKIQTVFTFRHKLRNSSGLCNCFRYPATHWPLSTIDGSLYCHVVASPQGSVPLVRPWSVAVGGRWQQLTLNVINSAPTHR